MIKETKKAPAIRFRDFTDDWEQRKFGELYKVNSGYAFRYEDYCLDGVALINGESIQHGVIDGTNLNYLPQNFLNEFSEFTLKEGDIVLGLNRPVTNGQLKMARISKQYNNSLLYQRAGKITLKKKMDENFSYVLLSNEILKYTVKEAVGSDQPFISTSKLSDWNMNIPDNIQEQKSIGTFFASLDKAITLHQRKLDQLKTLKKYFLQNMFPAKGEKVPRIRFKGFTGDWEQRKLGELAEIIGGGTPDTNNKIYWNGDINWYAPAEIVHQIYLNSSERKITEEGYNNSSAKMLPIGTVLFTSRAGIGKTAILTKEGCTNQGFQSIVPHKGKLDSYFIFSRTEELKNYGEKVGAGSTFVEVSGKQMANMRLMMPTTMKEQQQIGTYFENIDHLVTLHQRKLNQLQTMKKFMLQNMFI